MKLPEFIEEIYRFGLERFRRYYGPYRALVTSNQDPQSKGRIQIKCTRARLGEGNGIWVLPMEPGAGKNKGMFWPPDVDDAVWIFFDNGDPTRPLCYMGGWYGGEQATELHADLAPDKQGNPNRRGFVSPGGHKIVLDDTSGSEQIIIEQKSGQRVLIDNDGVKIGNKSGQFEAVMKGETFKELFNNHSHSTPNGISGPPTVPLSDNVLSNDTKTS